MVKYNHFKVLTDLLYLEINIAYNAWINKILCWIVYQSHLFPSETSNIWLWALVASVAFLREKTDKGQITNCHETQKPRSCNKQHTFFLPSDFLPLDAGIFILSLTFSSALMTCLRPFDGSVMSAAVSKLLLIKEKMSPSSLTVFTWKTNTVFSSMYCLKITYDNKSLKHIPAGLCGYYVEGTWCLVWTGRRVWSTWCRSLSASAECDWAAQPLRETQWEPHPGSLAVQFCRQQTGGISGMDWTTYTGCHRWCDRGFSG